MWLHFSSAYKHLGALFIPAGEVQCEIQSRLGQARLAYGGLKRYLFGNRRITTKTRLRLFESLIISRLCYGLSSWGYISSKQFQSIEAFIHRCQRYICGIGIDDGVTMDELTSRHKLCNLQQRLAYARITYATRVWEVGPTTLQELIQAEAARSSTSWWHFVLEDLRWCQSLVGEAFPVDRLDEETLMASWRRNPVAWRKIARKALKLGTLQEVTAADVRAWHTKALKTLVKGGAQIDGYSLGHIGDGQHQCEECGKCFTTAQGLTSHRRFKHGYQAPEAKWTQDTVTCPVCLKYMWSKQRLQQHLSYMPRNGTPNKCYAYLCRFGRAEVRELPGDGDRGLQVGATYGVNRRDALQAQGPRPEMKAPLQEELDDLSRQLVEQKEHYAKRYVYSEEIYCAAAAAWTSATTSWFEEAIDDGDPQRAQHTLQDHWLVCIDESVEPSATSGAFLEWGRTELPAIYGQWESGFAEQIAEQAYSDLIMEADIYIDEQKIQSLERRVRSTMEKLQEEENPRPHRPIRKGPETRRGGNKTVRQHFEKYNDDDG